MTDLAHKITMLLRKGNRTTAELVRVKVTSRETFRKIMKLGESVKVCTLMDIADFLDADSQQRTDLVNAWFKLEIAPYAKHLQMQALSTPRDDGSEDADKINELLASFPESDRHQIVICLHKLISEFSGWSRASRIKRKNS